MRLPRSLHAAELRVLGALLEKAQTTPDTYPLTFKALVAACNQKSGRQPVTRYSEAEVLDVLESLRRDVLVWRTEGARSERWNESITRRLELSPEARAVITLLLLRGPQTPGELRSRSDRYHPFESLEQVAEVLRSLAEGFEPLVLELPRQPGQKERRWVHLLAEPGAEETPSSGAAPFDLEAVERTGKDGAFAANSLAPDSLAPSTLAQRVENLESKVEELQEEVRDLRQRLGEDR